MSLDAELREAVRREDWPTVARLRARRGDKLTTLVWVTKKGTEIPVVHMDTNHLLNAVKLMQASWAFNFLTDRMEDAMLQELLAREKL